MTTIAINTDREGNARTIRASYGKCGVMSAFLSTGMGITAVAEIYDSQELCPEGEKHGRLAFISQPTKSGDRERDSELDNDSEERLISDRDI